MPTQTAAQYRKEVRLTFDTNTMYNDAHRVINTLEQREQEITKLESDLVDERRKVQKLTEHLAADEDLLQSYGVIDRPDSQDHMRYGDGG